MNVGERSIKAMRDLGIELIDSHAKRINEAFLKSDDGKVKVSLSYDIAVSEKKADYIDIDATISFTTEKVKTKVTESVSENQGALFEAVEKMIPKKGSGIDSVTLSSGDKSVTLNAR